MTARALASLRVLVVTHNYPRSRHDPAGAFIARLAHGVAARGHAVRVVAPHAASLPVDEAAGGVSVRRFRYAPEKLEMVAYGGDLHRRPLRSPMAAAVLPFFLAACRRAVRAAIRDFHPDVIHAHWWLPGGWAAATGDVPVIITCHGTDVRLLDQLPPLRPLARRVLGRAAAITTVSRFLSDDLARLLGPRLPAATVTPMPVDVRPFVDVPPGVPESPPRILFAGNLLQSKGVDVLVRALRLLKERGIECRLRVVGDGPERRNLENLVASLALGGEVEFAGPVALSAMPAEYARSAVTVLPTRGQAEGLGLVLVEALLAGSAVVGSPAGGIPEVITHGETGLLARDGDAGDLADQIERLITDPALRQATIQRGRERVMKTYAPQAAIPTFLDLYHAAVDRTPS